MSMHFSRNVVIPVWFAVFALVTIFAPPFNLFYSASLLIVGLAVPTIVYTFWHAPSLPLAVVARSIDATQTSPLTRSN